MSVVWEVGNETLLGGAAVAVVGTVVGSLVDGATVVE